MMMMMGHKGFGSLAYIAPTTQFTVLCCAADSAGDWQRRRRDILLPFASTKVPRRSRGRTQQSAPRDFSNTLLDTTTTLQVGCVFVLNGDDKLFCYTCGVCRFPAGCVAAMRVWGADCGRRPGLGCQTACVVMGDIIILLLLLCVYVDVLSAARLAPLAHTPLVPTDRIIHKPFPHWVSFCSPCVRMVAAFHPTQNDAWRALEDIQTVCVCIWMMWCDHHHHPRFVFHTRDGITSRKHAPVVRSCRSSLDGSGLRAGLWLGWIQIRSTEFPFQTQTQRRAFPYYKYVVLA